MKALLAALLNLATLVVITATVTALAGWLVSLLVSFIFGITFGFWKGVALLVLSSILVKPFVLQDRKG